MNIKKIFIFIMTFALTTLSYANTIRLKDEGAVKGYPWSLNFIGDGVTATMNGTEAEIAVPGGGSGSSPGGSDGQIQYNNGGLFGGASGFYWDDTNSSIGIGMAYPTAYLHLKAGTASANTAPLKFTPGANLTIPEAGAVEFDGDNLYFTDTAVVRQTLEKQSNKGAASGYASLDASSKVMQDPANATATPTALKIPIADASGKLDGWITLGSSVDLASEVTGNLPTSNLNGGENASASTYWRGDGKWVAPTTTIQFTISEPSQLTNMTTRATPSVVVWSNTENKTFTVESIKSVTDIDNYNYTIFKSNNWTDINVTNDVLMQTIVVADDGVGAFYNNTTTLTNNTIEAGKHLIFEHNSGNATQVKIVISGSY